MTVQRTLVTGAALFECRQAQSLNGPKKIARKRKTDKHDVFVGVGLG